MRQIRVKADKGRQKTEDKNRQEEVKMTDDSRKKWVVCNKIHKGKITLFKIKVTNNLTKITPGLPQ